VTFGPSFWTNVLRRALDSLGSQPVLIVDARTPSEARFGEDNGFVLVRIHRCMTAEEYGAHLAGRSPDHILETGLDTWPFRYSVLNDGTKSDYFQAWDRVLEELVAPK